MNLKFSTEGGTMSDLVDVKQNFRKIVGEWLRRQKCNFLILLETIHIIDELS